MCQLAMMLVSDLFKFEFGPKISQDSYSIAFKQYLKIIEKECDEVNGILAISKCNSSELTDNKEITMWERFVSKFLINLVSKYITSLVIAISYTYWISIAAFKEYVKKLNICNILLSSLNAIASCKYRQYIF